MHVLVPIIHRNLTGLKATQSKQQSQTVQDRLVKQAGCAWTCVYTNLLVGTSYGTASGCLVAYKACTAGAVTQQQKLRLLCEQ